MEPEDTSFASGGVRCAAWVFRPAGSGPHPCVVMAHGFGAVREARLDAYARRFAAAGIASVVFDYRSFGASEGTPRQLLSVRRQLEDYEAAIAFARALPGIDPGRIALWGSSFSGGHVLALGARRTDLAAIVAQAPAADLFAAVLKVPPWNNLRLFALALCDLAAAVFGNHPVRVNVVGPPGTLAVMTSPDADAGYRAMLPVPTTWRNEICARAFATLAAYRPGARAARIAAPLLVCVAARDAVTPPGPAEKASRRAPRGELKTYPIGHFEIYHGAWFECAVADQLAFLARALRLAPCAPEGQAARASVADAA